MKDNVGIFDSSNEYKYSHESTANITQILFTNMKMYIKKETVPLHHVKYSLQMFLQITDPLGLHEKDKYLV